MLFEEDEPRLVKHVVMYSEKNGFCWWVDEILNMVKLDFICQNSTKMTKILSNELAQKEIGQHLEQRNFFITLLVLTYSIFLCFLALFTYLIRGGTPPIYRQEIFGANQRYFLGFNLKYPKYFFHEVFPYLRGVSWSLRNHIHSTYTIS